MRNKFVAHFITKQLRVLQKAFQIAKIFAS